MRYVAVRNFERFQHYRDRRPLWVKLYLSILKDADFGSLTVSARLTFLLLLLLAGERDNRIPSDAGWLAVELNVPRNIATKALDELLAHGYLVPASDPASNGASGSLPPHARPRARGETETETEQTRTTTDVGGSS